MKTKTSVVNKKNKRVVLKNILSFSLTAILATLLLSPAEARMVPSFNDVANHWAKGNIEWATENGVVGGYEDGSFRPNRELTEAEFASMLSRFATNIEVKGEVAPGEHWASRVYDALNEYGIPLKGYGNKTVMNRAVNRGTIAQIVAAKNGFNLDVQLAVEYMYENDLSGGFDANLKNFQTYGADKLLTRAQAVAFMQRLDGAGVTTFRGETAPVSDGRTLGNIKGTQQKTVANSGAPDWSKFNSGTAPKPAGNFGSISGGNLTAEQVEMVKQVGILSMWTESDWLDASSNMAKYNACAEEIRKTFGSGTAVDPKLYYTESGDSDYFVIVKTNGDVVSVNVYRGIDGYVTGGYTTRGNIGG